MVRCAPPAVQNLGVWRSFATVPAGFAAGPWPLLLGFVARRLAIGRLLKV